MARKKMILRIGNTNRRGFTLVEMLVVLAIIAMILGLSVPFTSGFGKGLRIKTAARAILFTLRVARSNAITHRENYAVIFDAESGEYWIEDNNGNVLEKKHRLPSSIRFEVKADEDKDPITFRNDKVVFYPTGVVGGHSGSITITGKRGLTKTISVIASTAKITID